MVGFSWIYFSDHLLATLGLSTQGYVAAQTVKGMVYVFATALIIFIEVRRTMVKREVLSDSIQESNYRLEELNRSLQSKVTELEKSQATIDWQSRMIDQFYREVDAPIVMWDIGGRIVRANDYYWQLAGIPAKTERIYSGYASRPQDAIEGREYLSTMGDRIINWLDKVFEVGEGKRFVISIGRDVTAARQHEMEIRELVDRDHLTGLYNRNRFDRDVDSLLQGGRPFHLLYMDIDDFKMVNDLYGYKVGDEILVRLANLMLNLFSQGDLYRWSGDEFVVICHKSTRQFIDGKLEQLYEYLEDKWAFGVDHFHLTVSTGIVSCPKDGRKADELLRNADLAIRVAKKSGKSRYEGFRPELLREMEMRVEMYRKLDEAIDRDQLHLHYQPVYRLSDRKVIQLEVLLRWSMEGLEMPTCQLIEIAEESDRITRIDHWVIDKVFRSVMTMPACFSQTSLAINLSSRTFQSDGFAKHIDGCLSRYGIDPRRIQFEITEHSIVDNFDETLHVMKALKRRGISVSMDDFGTKYSSLNYLARLPFDVLKIDRSYVQQSVSDPKTFNVVKSIIGLSHGLGLQTVAEGIETREQEQLMRSIGCDVAQGYLFAPPMSLEALEKMMEVEG